MADIDGRPKGGDPHAIRVVVADDDPFARRMVCERLTTDDVQVVGQAHNGEVAVALALDLMPDIVIMDLSMPDCDGISATRRIAQRAPEIQVVILSITKSQDAVLLALTAGAVGFLEKRIEMDALLRVVRGVHRGEAALDRRFTRALINAFRATAARAEIREPKTTQSAGSSLSQREQEVLELLAAGHGTESISSELALAPATVRTHIKSIFRKLKVNSRGAAVSNARSQGLIGRSIGPIETSSSCPASGVIAEPLQL